MSPDALKSHRYLDGRKIYQLHPLTGPAEPVERSTVEFLKKQRLIDSNKKFPAATYLLTEKGLNLAIWLSDISHIAGFSQSHRPKQSYAN